MNEKHKQVSNVALETNENKTSLSRSTTVTKTKIKNVLKVYIKRINTTKQLVKLKSQIKNNTIIILYKWFKNNWCK